MAGVGQKENIFLRWRKFFLQQEKEKNFVLFYISPDYSVLGALFIFLSFPPAILQFIFLFFSSSLTFFSVEHLIKKYYTSSFVLCAPPSIWQIAIVHA